MERDRAIVLYCGDYPGFLCTLLDSHHGVVAGRTRGCPLYVGSYLEYTRCTRECRTHFRDVEPVKNPCIETLDDLVVSHIALGVCHECMPEGSTTAGVFEHLEGLYNEKQSAERRYSSFLKKVFLCRLCMLLGLYPHEKKFMAGFFCRLMGERADCGDGDGINAGREGEVDEWLRACVRDHASNHGFKALRMMDSFAAL